jgi:hypothetical protein
MKQFTNGGDFADLSPVPKPGVLVCEVTVFFGREQFELPKELPHRLLTVLMQLTDDDQQSAAWQKERIVAQKSQHRSQTTPSKHNAL